MATPEPPATPEAKADGSKKAAERQSAVHLSAARYWFGGAALAVILMVLIILLMSTGESVVCQKKGETVLCVALALGIGFGFLGGTAKIEGRGDWWGIGFPVTAAFSGGIAGVLLGIWAVDFVVGKQCKLPEPIACNEYAADGTCKRCLGDVSFSRVKRGGTLGQPLYCNSMKANTAVEVSFHAYTMVDEHEQIDRKVVIVGLVNPADNKEYTRGERRDAAPPEWNMTATTRTNELGAVGVRTEMLGCAWQTNPNFANDWSCSGVGIVELRSN